jgi:hypothetical protein
MSLRFHVRFVNTVGEGDVGEKTYFTWKINVFIVFNHFYTPTYAHIYYQSLKHFVHLIAPTCFDTQRVIIRELYFPG